MLLEIYNAFLVIMFVLTVQTAIMVVIHIWNASRIPNTIPNFFKMLYLPYAIVRLDEYKIKPPRSVERKPTIKNVTDAQSKEIATTLYNLHKIIKETENQDDTTSKETVKETDEKLNDAIADVVNVIKRYC